MAKLFVEDVELGGRRALTRIDFDVPGASLQFPEGEELPGVRQLSEK